MEVTLIGFFTFTLLLCCVLHYEGLVNVHLKLGMWHLKCAEKARERYRQEREKILKEAESVLIEEE